MKNFRNILCLMLAGICGSALSVQAAADHSTPSVFQIAFVCKGKLLLINSDGTDSRQLYASSPDALVNGPVWSPDGKKIVFSLGESMKSPDYGMGIVDVQTGIVEMFRSQGAYHSDPAWSPDSQKLAINADGMLQVIDVKTKETIAIATNAYNVEIKDPKTGKVNCKIPGSVVWPQNEEIVYVSGFHSPEISKIFSGGGKLPVVLEGDVNPFVLAASPDGAKIVYSTHGAEGLLVLSDLTGQTKNSLGKYGLGGKATWSPNGNRLAVNGVKGAISIVNAANGAREDFPNGASGCWSPEGKRIAYRVEDGLHLYDVEKKSDSKIHGDCNDRSAASWGVACSPR